MSGPRLPPGQAARLLEDVIFARVAELIDLPRLYDLESMLALQIEDLGVTGPAGATGATGQAGAGAARTGEDEIDLSRAIAKAMVDQALLRVARTSRKWTRWGSPRPPGEDACDICGSPCGQEQSPCS